MHSPTVHTLTSVAAIVVALLIMVVVLPWLAVIAQRQISSSPTRRAQALHPYVVGAAFFISMEAVGIIVLLAGVSGLELPVNGSAHLTIITLQVLFLVVAAVAFVATVIIGLVFLRQATSDARKRSP